MSASCKNLEGGHKISAEVKETEYLIVGQGLAGTMLAFEMLERNMSFHVLSSPYKSRASMVAAGMVNPLVHKRLIKSWMVDALLPQMINRYRGLERLLNNDFYFERKILKPLSDQELLLWEKKKSYPDFQAYISAILKTVDVNGLKEAAAYGEVTGAGYLNLSAFLHSAEVFLRERQLLSEGLLTNADFNFEKAYFEVDDIRARKIIFCEGYHLTKNPLFDFVKMNPAKGEVLLIHAPSLSEDYILNKQVFVLPVGNQLFKVGSTYEWENLNETPTLAGKESIIARLENLIRVDYEIKEHWAGVRPTISDRRPVLGRHPQFSNLFVFNGMGTKGVMLAPQMASLFCDSLTKSNFKLPAEIDVNRFA